MSNNCGKNHYAAKDNWKCNVMFVKKFESRKLIWLKIQRLGGLLYLILPCLVTSRPIVFTVAEWLHNVQFWHAYVHVFTFKFWVNIIVRSSSPSNASSQSVHVLYELASCPAEPLRSAPSSCYAEATSACAVTKVRHIAVVSRRNAPSSHHLERYLVAFPRLGQAISPQDPTQTTTMQKAHFCRLPKLQEPPSMFAQFPSSSVRAPKCGALDSRFFLWDHLDFSALYIS